MPAGTKPDSIEKLGIYPAHPEPRAGFVYRQGFL
jgi:hypothetical protein